MGGEGQSNGRRALRLGFAVKVMGRPDLKSNDSRRWQNNPHLKVSLEYLDAIFDYLLEQDIDMYRMSSDLAPYATHPDMPQFHNMLEESHAELQALGRRAREQKLRLSFHPSQFVLLNSPDPQLTRKSIWDLSSQSEMLDRMMLGSEAVVVTHVGGVYGDREESRARWVENWERLPDHVRNRLVLENDDIRFSAADVLWVHERTGVRLVFDYQHFCCLNPEGLDLVDTVARFMKSWPRDVRPKIHFSTPRTEFRQTERVDKKTGKKVSAQQEPVWTNHADFINPFEFIRFMRDVGDLEFDVMLESKAKDVSLLRLRSDLTRFAPDVGKRFGTTAEPLT
ncbi:UV DNA damage repair endonuclease UvsE [Proteobacteria bacterium 005FR1]|nr:UV DNA damage repair endonuclease UvsE [Proteobacteria bacterium 005FR1]